MEAVCERMPMGILILERIDPEAAACCWRIIADLEWEAQVWQDA